MPEISRFFGIIIKMYFGDHAPPNFHAEYNEYMAVIDIHSLVVINGELPPRALGMVVEWGVQHRAELLELWNLTSNHQRCTG